MAWWASSTRRLSFEVACGAKRLKHGLLCILKLKFTQFSMTKMTCWHTSRISRHRFAAEASQRGSCIECRDIYKEHLGANVETLVEEKKIKEPVVTDKPISRV
jgi:hypothetical protein